MKFKTGDESTVYNFDQGTVEWHEARLGKVTASRVSSLLVKGKGSMFGKGAMTYLNELVAEKLTGTYKDFSSEATDHGKITEDEAREVFKSEQLDKGLDIIEVGFISGSEYVGVSPDGVIVDKETGEWVALCEIKCPFNQDKILGYRDDGLTDKSYIAQVQMQMLLAGVDKTYFVVYDPRYPEGLDMYVEVVEVDKKFQENLTERIEAFSDMIKTKVDSLLGVED